MRKTSLPGARTLLSFGGISLYFLNKKHYYIKIITLRNKIAQYIFFKKVKMAKHLQTFLPNSSRPKVRTPYLPTTPLASRSLVYVQNVFFAVQTNSLPKHCSDTARTELAL